MTDRRPEDERLARRLDQAIPPGDARTPRETSDPLVNTALLLARMKLPPMSAEADARIEARVLATMRAQRQPRRRVIPLARWLVAACLAVAILSAGIVPLAAQSLPGDPLYGIKQGLEQIERLAARTPAALAQVYLTQAERRLEEGVQLASQGRFEPDLLRAAMASLNASSSAASDASDEALVQAVEQRATIVSLRFAALMDELEVTPTPAPTPEGEASTNQSARVEPVNAEPQVDNSLPSPTATATPQPMPTRRPADLPMPPGLATRLAPAADVIATRAAEPTATPPAWGRNGGLPDNANPNAGPGNNSGGNANPNAGSGNNSGGTNPNAGPGNNSGGGNPPENPGGGSANGNANGNANPNSGTGNNSGGGNTNPNAGPGNNSGGGNPGNPPPENPGNSSGNANGNSQGNSGNANPNEGPGNNSGDGNPNPGGGNANPNSGPGNNSGSGNPNPGSGGNANGNSGNN